MRFLDGILKTFMPLREVEAKAKDCFDSSLFSDEKSLNSNVEKENETEKNVNRLERFIDWLVRCSGSKTAFIFIQICLITWAFLGIPFNQIALWPIFISDAQAIVSYIFDTLLMRQQLKGFANELETIAKLRSRNESKMRMIQSLLFTNPDLFSFSNKTDDDEVEKELTFKRPLFERYLTKLAAITGHIWSVGFFCLSIIIWLSFGPKNQWSNEWQLYINSATSAWMVFLFSLLAVVREGHALREHESMKAIHTLDCEIETNLRSLTGDLNKNETVFIQVPKQNIVQTIINVYAYIVGGLVGLFILIVVFAVWFAIGPVMHFNDNWWLLIGTYSGLIGMNDGFVLRNVQHQIETLESQQFDLILKQDQNLHSFITPSKVNEKAHQEEIKPSINLTQKISNAVCTFTAHQITVVVGVLSIIGMLVGASAMHWSLTGQLICNVPPSIIESLFMQILITGHMAGDKRKQQDVLLAYKNRQILLNKLKSIELTSSFVKKTLDEKFEKETSFEDPDVIILEA